MPAELETGWLELVHGRKRSWWTGPARVSLQVLGGLYGAVIGTYRLQYDWGWRRPEAAPCRICSVGNLTVGGSGKTTTVRWIVRRLQEWGVRPAILSHGYRASGGSDPRPRVVADPTGIRLPITESGDEPQLLARRLPSVPVLIGRRRNESARVAAEQYGVQVCVLDDGYQYWKVQKNLDLLLLDATSPWGPGGVFPGGTLREPRAGIRRADLILLTHAAWADPAAREKLKQWLSRSCVRAGSPVPVAEARHVPVALYDLAGCRRDLEELRGEPWLPLSSLGRPEALERTLRDLGSRAVSGERFPDHHPYSAEELRRVCARVREEGLAGVVTTEKDAVKLQPDWLGNTPCRVLEVDLEFLSGRQELDELLRDRLAGA